MTTRGKILVVALAVVFLVVIGSMNDESGTDENRSQGTSQQSAQSSGPFFLDGVSFQRFPQQWNALMPAPIPSMTIDGHWQALDNKYGILSRDGSLRFYATASGDKVETLVLGAATGKGANKLFTLAAIQFIVVCTPNFSPVERRPVTQWFGDTLDRAVLKGNDDESTTADGVKFTVIFREDTFGIGCSATGTRMASSESNQHEVAQRQRESTTPGASTSAPTAESCEKESIANLDVRLKDDQDILRSIQRDCAVRPGPALCVSRKIKAFHDTNGADAPMDHDVIEENDKECGYTTTDATAQRIVSTESGVQPTPSFDCTKTLVHAELEICAVPLLAKLDSTLAKDYKMMIAANIGDGARDALKTSEMTWIKERDECATDAECLQRSYRRRIDSICDYPVISGVHPDCQYSDEIQ